MKKAGLEKKEAAKLSGHMKQTDTPGRFGAQSASVPDRREQRKIDQSLGLVPFAVKLNSELVKEIQALAQSRNASVNEVVAELLQKALKGAGS
jgi:hypothetical protein